MVGYILLVLAVLAWLWTACACLFPRDFLPVRPNHQDLLASRWFFLAGIVVR